MKPVLGEFEWMAKNEAPSWFSNATSNLSGYGRLLESLSIAPWDNSTKQRSDAAGRTLRSLDQLDTCPGGGKTLASETASDRRCTVLTCGADRQMTRCVA